ncbi:PAS domain S-box protein [Williamwhitmania taraxaci]|uniref:histidine kinase n=1 Tax=Williamwhitmania taraxaci TaxID=1640674 RepID=A0A1G6H316_9BACT|nr:PAS domain S-box protein [Williamwhitmania taraxaci]SDB88591.1 PAS domain S-box-containing protein [Williamwhitmania taraxaci]
MKDNKQKKGEGLTEQELATIVSQISTGISIIQDGKIVFCNDQYAKIIGVTKEALINKSLIEVVHSKDKRLLALILAKDFPEIKDKKRNTLTYRILDSSGTLKWLKSSLSIIEWNGAPALLDSAIDFTTQKLNEAVVFEEERNFRLLYNSIDDLIVIVNSTLHVIQTNSVAIKLLGYKDYEILHKSIDEIHTPEIKNLASELFLNPLLPDRRNIITEISKANGEPLITETSILRGNWSDRPVLFFVSRNITEKINAEKAVKASEEKFHKAFETNPISMAITTKDGGVFIDVNSSFIKTFGYKSKREIIGRTTESIKFYHNEQDNQQILRTLEEEGGFDNRETLLHKANGEIVFALYSGEVINIFGQDCIISAINDITHRKQVENALQERTAQLGSILNNLPFMAWIKNMAGEFLAVNEAFAHHYNRSVEDILGHTDFDFWQRSTAELYKQSDDLIESTKEKLFFESSDIIDGKTVHWETFKSPVFDSEGKIIATTGINRDITEQKESQLEREKNLQWQELLTDFSFTLSVSPVLDQVIEKQLAKIVNLLDLSRSFFMAVSETHIAQIDYEWCAPEVKRRKHVSGHINLEMAARLNIKVTQGEIIVVENVLIDLPEQLQTLLKARETKALLIAPIYRQSDFVGLLCFEDIRTPRVWRKFEKEGLKTIANLLSSALERKQAETLLTKSEKKFREFAEQLPEIVFETNIAGTITYANNQLYKDFYIDREQTKINLSELISPKDHPRFESIFKEAILKMNSPIGEFNAVSSAQNEFPILLHLSPLMEDDQCKGTRGLLINISEQKKQENEILKAKETAEKASKAKEEFLSVMSHEIRTPLNAVIGLSNLMLQESPRKDQEENLETLLSSAYSLLALINDILDFSKIEAGKVTIEMQPFNIFEFVRDIAKRFELTAQHRGIDLITMIDPDLPKVLISDPFRLNQIITNLVGNGIKFTNDGAVTIEIKPLKQSKQNILVQFSIKDTGIGIRKEKQSEIFKEFTQADAAITRKYGGTGLGLAICKRLVSLLGGEIQLKSTPETGSVFFFNLWLEIEKTPHTIIPKEKIIEPTFPRDGEQPLQGFSVLVVEDNEINKLIVKKFLIKWGAEFHHAENGQIAVEMANENYYNLILMDIEMPVMGGYEATQMIRSGKSKCKTIPIIALTASALPDIQKRILEAGMNDYLLKPFNPNNLRHKISEWVRKQ